MRLVSPPTLVEMMRREGGLDPEEENTDTMARRERNGWSCEPGRLDPLLSQVQCLDLLEDK